MEDLYAVVLCYNKNGADCRSLLTLVPADYKRVLIADNSDRPTDLERYAGERGFQYLSLGGNRGLAVAYNRAVAELDTEEGLVCFFDDDTELPADYARSLQRSAALQLGGQIFLPLVFDAKGLLSPCAIKGDAVRRIRDPRELSYTATTGINSGMAVKLSLFRRHRFREEMFLDYIDHQFLRECKRSGVRIVIFSARLQQNFSDNAADRAAALRRFRIFKRDFATFCRSAPYCRRALFRRGLKLALRHRSPEFLMLGLSPPEGVRADHLGLLPEPAAAPAPSPYTVSASIVNYNCLDQVARAAASLRENTAGVPLSVFVVDNGSAGVSKGDVQAACPGCEVLMRGRNLGYGQGHNAVLQRLTSRYHAIVNPDIELQSDAVTELTQFLERHPEVILAVPRILNPDGTEQHLPKRDPTFRYLLANRFFPRLMRRSRARYLMTDREMSGPHEIEFATGCFTVIRTDVFKQLGGFDPRYFMYFEDADLTREARRFGKAAYCPGVAVIHSWSRSSAHSARLFLLHIQSMLRYFGKWRERSQPAHKITRN